MKWHTWAKLPFRVSTCPTSTHRPSTSLLRVARYSWYSEWFVIVFWALMMSYMYSITKTQNDVCFCSDICLKNPAIVCSSHSLVWSGLIFILIAIGWESSFNQLSLELIALVNQPSTTRNEVIPLYTDCSKRWWDIFLLQFLEQKCIIKSSE